MLRNRPNWKTGILTLKLLSLSAAFLLQTACGGGGASEASALGITDVTVAFIKRPTPRDNNNIIITNDMRQPATFEEGGDLYLLPLTNSTSVPINITKSITNKLGDVKGVSVSYDGTKLVFSLRIPDPNDGSIISWNLYEYDITNNSLTALISAGIRDNGDDISPRYLPDGRIIFASTRQTGSKGVRINENRPVFTALDEDHVNFAFSLHVWNRDDNTIKQVSFNESNDLDPIVLKESGRVVFSRWNNMGGRNDISLYSMNPDGTDVQMYYGAHSHTNANLHFYKPREAGNGQIMTIFRPFVTNFGGGSIILIDGKNFADNTQPIWSQQGMISGPAQTTFIQNVPTPTGLSLNGRYNAAFPILDGTNRYLMSWNPCKILNDPLIPFDPVDPTANIIPCTLATQAQLNDVNVIEAPPNFSIMLVAPNSSQVPLFTATADTLLSEVVIANATVLPPIIFDKIPGVSPEIDAGLAIDGVGLLHIRSVYDFDNNFSAYATSLPTLDNDGMPITIDTPAEMANPKNTTADQRPARFVRITKGVSIPNIPAPLDDSAYGVSTQQGMREIVGYAPIEPDGSVKIKVPANVPLTIGILDKDGRRISNRHQSWFQVKPGETLECIGCHVHDTANQDSNKPHGRPDTTSTFNPGATTTGIGFPFSLDSLWAEIGETMAETRARQGCLPTNPVPCADMKPSADLIYSDVWTDDVAANRSADPSFTIDYTAVPVSPLASGSTTATACANGYNNLPTSFANCRVVINYVEHIQPIWEDTINRATACIACHTAANAVNAGELDLTSSQSVQQANHITSYQELLATDVGSNTAPSMSTAGARSSLFMELMTGEDLNNDAIQPTDTQNHNLMLNPSELKLIAEWLDMGAQYFNNPLDPAVPTN